MYSSSRREEGSTIPASPRKYPVAVSGNRTGDGAITLTIDLGATIPLGVVGDIIGVSGSRDAKDTTVSSVTLRGSYDPRLTALVKMAVEGNQYVPIPGGLGWEEGYYGSIVVTLACSGAGGVVHTAMFGIILEVANQ